MNRAFSESPDHGRGIRVVPRALGSSLGGGLLCFMGVDVVIGRCEDILIVGAGPRACPSLGNYRGLPLRVFIKMEIVDV